MKLCSIHGVKNKFANELFTFLQLHLLLEPNCLPNNYYAPKNIDSKIGIRLQDHSCMC